MPDDSALNPLEDAAETRRRKLRSAKRDDTGFSVEALPNLSTQQVKWIAARAGSSTMEAANDMTSTSSADVLEWFNDPDFVALYQEMMENKREGFKQLATQVLPNVLTTLLSVMQHGEKDADRVKAATLLLRNQGLLVDKVTTTDPDAIKALLDEIRKPRPVYKTLANPKDRDAQG